MTAMEANRLGLVNRLLGIGDEVPTAVKPVDVPPTTVVVKILERRDVLFNMDICARDIFCG
jgi:hypothetical protein